MDERQLGLVVVLAAVTPKWNLGRAYPATRARRQQPRLTEERARLSPRHAAPASAAAAPPWPVRLGPPLSAVAALCSDKRGGGGVRGESD